MSSSVATDSSPKKAELAAARAKPRGSSYDADELNEIRNLSLGDDEGAAGSAGASYKRGRRGSGGGGHHKEQMNDHASFHFLSAFLHNLCPDERRFRHIQGSNLNVTMEIQNQCYCCKLRGKLNRPISRQAVNRLRRH